MGLSTAEAVVVGGGVIGTASAYYLARCGVRVELVERNGLATGTSGACLDAVALQSKAPGPTLTLARESQQMYHRLSEELDWGLEFRQEGSLVAALSQPEVEYLSALVSRLRDAGVHVELLDGPAARDLQPALSPEVLAASYCPQDCQVNPFRVCQGFAAAATRLGVKIRLGAEVVGVETRRGRVAAVLTSQGRIETPLVVDAAGVWAPAVARMVGLELPVVPRRGQILVTERLSPLVRGRLFGAPYLMSKLRKPAEGGDGAGSGYLSGPIFGQQASGNLLIGSTREYVGFNCSVTQRAAVDLARQAVRLLPSLREVRVIRAFAGLRPAPREGGLIIRRYHEPEGFLVATGHEGDGIGLAPVTGKTVAEIATGRFDDYRDLGGLSCAS